MKTMETKLQSQKGFTLVEIAIVLVIIGLLLGGVLKGQEMINAAKIKNDTDSLKSIQASVYAFRDRAGYYPGTTRATTPTVSTADGIQITPIASSATTTYTAANISTSGTENAWADLWDQGFLKTPNMAPAIDDGGAFSIGYAEDGTTAGAFATAANVQANKNYICIGYTASTTNAEQIAVGMDVKFDDGDPDTGIVRYSSAAAGGANICLEI